MERSFLDITRRGRSKGLAVSRGVAPSWVPGTWHPGKELSGGPEPRVGGAAGGAGYAAGP